MLCCSRAVLCQLQAQHCCLESESCCPASQRRSETVYPGKSVHSSFDHVQKTELTSREGSFVLVAAAYTGRVRCRLSRQQLSLCGATARDGRLAVDNRSGTCPIGAPVRPSCVCITGSQRDGCLRPRNDVMRLRRAAGVRLGLATTRQMAARKFRGPYCVLMNLDDQTSPLPIQGNETNGPCGTSNKNGLYVTTKCIIASWSFIHQTLLVDA